jgi:hypothetical protein
MIEKTGPYTSAGRVLGIGSSAWSAARPVRERTKTEILDYLDFQGCRTVCQAEKLSFAASIDKSSAANPQPLAFPRRNPPPILSNFDYP